MCKLMDRITNFSILPLKYNINMEMKYDSKNKGYYMTFLANDGYVCHNDRHHISTSVQVIEEVTEFGVNYTLTDKFSTYRVYAANSIMDGFVSAIENLNDVISDYISDADVREAEIAMLKMRINNGALHQMDNIVKSVYTLDKMMSDSEESLKNELKKEANSLSVNMQKKLAQEIRKAIKAQYANDITYINNELRACYNAWKISPEDAVKFVDSKVKSSVASKVLKEERFIAMSKNSDTPNFTKKISKSIGEALIQRGLNTVTACNGALMIFNIYGEDPVVNVIDGDYDVVFDGNDYFLSRPYADFVEIPAFNNKIRMISQFVKTKEQADALDAALVAGEEYVVKKDGKNHKFFLADASGNKIVELYFGKNDKIDGMKWKENTLLSNRYVNVPGKLIGKSINLSARADENGNIRYNYIIAMEEV